MDILRYMSKGIKFIRLNKAIKKQPKILDFLCKRSIIEVGKKVDDRL